MDYDLYMMFAKQRSEVLTGKSYMFWQDKIGEVMEIYSNRDSHSARMDSALVQRMFA